MVGDDHQRPLFWQRPEPLRVIAQVEGQGLDGHIEETRAFPAAGLMLEIEPPQPVAPRRHLQRVDGEALEQGVGGIRVGEGAFVHAEPVTTLM